SPGRKPPGLFSSAPVGDGGSRYSKADDLPADDRAVGRTAEGHAHALAPLVAGNRDGAAVDIDHAGAADAVALGLVRGALRRTGAEVTAVRAIMVTAVVADLDAEAGAAI